MASGPSKTCGAPAYHGEIKINGSTPVTIKVSLTESSPTVAFVKKSEGDENIQLADLIIGPFPEMSRDELLFRGYFLADVTQFIERHMESIAAHFLPTLAVSDRQHRCIMQNDGVANNQYLVRLIIGHRSIIDKYLRTGDDSLINPELLEGEAISSFRKKIFPDEGND